MPDPDYDDSGVPTFDAVREKIESRYQTALGGAELDAESEEGRSLEEQYEKRQQAAADRLADIRESMRKDQT
jgi:phage shock protein A